MPKEITSMQEFRRINQTRPVVLVFGRDNCPYCVKLAPYIERMEKQYGSVSFLHVDTSRQNDVAANYSVRGVPMTAVHAAGGREVARVTGCDPAKIEAAVKEVNTVSLSEMTGGRTVGGTNGCAHPSREELRLARIAARN